MSVTILHYYDTFATACENFGLDPKYVVFSVVSALAAAVFGVGLRGTGKLAWLGAKGGFYAARGTVRYLKPKPDALGQLVLDALKEPVYVHDHKTPQLHGRGVTASLLLTSSPKTDVVCVAVDGRFITELVDDKALAEVKKKFTAERKKFAAKMKEEDAKFKAERVRQTKLALLRARANDALKEV
jgi:hypothetical protein